MAIDVTGKLGTVLKTAQTVLNSKYPNEFELYMCALELVSAKTGKTLSYFVFPIMPNSIDFTSHFPTNILQTFGGVSILSTTNFAPFDINLSGTFGRGYRLQIGNSFFDISSLASSLKSLSDLKNVFDAKLKSGYSYCKILETLINESQAIDTDGQRVLYFYNLAFNQKYVVEPGSISFKQDMNSNMIWNYNLTLKAVAPLDLVDTFHSDGRILLEINKSLSKDLVLKTIGSKIGALIKTML